MTPCLYSFGMYRTFGLFLLSATTCLVHAEVYKCAVEGKTVYQDSPCDGGKRVDVPGAKRKAQASTVRGVAVGMTESEVRSTWGEPSRIFHTTYTGASLEVQWIYDNHFRLGASDHVLFRSGIVTSITSSVPAKR